MPHIATISYDDATGKLRRLYDRIKAPGNNVDNVMMVHSLRPHTMQGHMSLYKSVLHHSDNTLPKWFLETLGVWVSVLNRCGYCVDHHFAGLRRLLGDNARADAIKMAMDTGNLDTAPLTEAQKLAMVYASRLTRCPAEVSTRMIAGLRDSGFTDAEILEINQVTAYFCYANRTVLGLGVTTDGDHIGLSPGNSDDPEDWSHA